MKSVVFDVGNVLLHWDPRLPYRKRFSSDEEIHAFFKAVDFENWNIAFDRNKDWDVDINEWIKQYPAYESEIRIFVDSWHESVPYSIDQSVEVMKTLLECGQPVYGITNFSAKRWAECQIRFPFLTEFTDVVVSSHEKLVKPDPQIYSLLLSRNRLNATDCIFIDDSLKNIEAAQRIGFKTIHFSLETRLAEELHALGVTQLDRTGNSLYQQ